MDLDDDAISEFLNDEIEWDNSTSNGNRDTGAGPSTQRNANSQFTTDEPEPTEDHLKVLSRCFGHKNFRPMQWKIISSLINDRRDNCAIMATGYGKSLCYQYPSVYCGGVSIIISPLISLMEDQVLSMKIMNIPACLLGTAQNKKTETMNDIFANKYSLIYVTPEFCTGEQGRDILKRLNDELCITLIAVDEAHCVSTWGHDFRFQYRELGMLRNQFPNTPILAVTATATPKVQQDIIKMLKLRDPQVLRTGFNRPNLYFSVYPKGSTLVNDVKKLMSRIESEWKFDGSTIIYCITRKSVEEVCEILKLMGLKCMAYHAGLSVGQRKETHEMFVRDKIDVIVATIAFGMGIDKPDVRNIIHYGASGSIEAYYQEVGRAGRDGLPAHCCTFFNSYDFQVHRNMREMGYGSEQNKASKEAMANEMLQYLNTYKCRRQFLLNHFESRTKDDPPPKEKCCDNCTKRLTQTETDSEKYEGIDENGLYDFSEDAFTFLSAVEAMDGKFGINMYILFIRGSHSAKLYEKYTKHVLHGSGKDKSEDWWKAVGNLLEIHKYLVKKALSKLPRNIYTVTLTNQGTKFLATYKSNKTERIKLYPTPEMFKLLKKKKSDKPEWKSKQDMEDPPSRSKKMSSFKFQDGKEKLDQKLYRLLLNKRTELASENDCMPYMIASNQAVSGLATHQPLTLKQLEECQLDGFTVAKINKFGKQFINIIRTYCGLDAKDDVAGSATKSIEEILQQDPLPSSKVGSSAELTWSMYKAGLSVNQIAQKRQIIRTTVLTHLHQAFKAGYPITLESVGVTKEIKKTVMEVIKRLPDGHERLMPIKEACPPEISYEQIKFVCTYMQIRQHLNDLKIPYKEIEDEPFENSATASTSNIQEKSQESFCNDNKTVEKVEAARSVNNEEEVSEDFNRILDSPPPFCSQKSQDTEMNDDTKDLTELIDAGKMLMDWDDLSDTEPANKKAKVEDNSTKAKVEDNSTKAKVEDNSTKAKDTLEDKTNNSCNTNNGKSKSKKALPPWLSKKIIA